MLNVAVFPNIDKENAPMVLKRIVDFYHDKDVKILMPMDGAKFFIVLPAILFWTVKTLYIYLKK